MDDLTLTFHPADLQLYAASARVYTMNKPKLDASSPAFTPSRNDTPSAPQLKPQENGRRPHRHSDKRDDFDLQLDEEVLAGNVKIRGKRAEISINHLLDFSLPSRETDSRPSRPRRQRRSSNNEERVHLVGQEYVNANYRFVVDSRGDYRSQVLDPNCIIDDPLILRVIVPKGHQCPICLSEDIVAPRMISCGHIFCQTCLLRFLHSEQTPKKGAMMKKYKECPLCSLSVRPYETKMIIIDESLNVDIPHEDQTSLFKLIARPVDSILPLPYDLDVDRHRLGNIPWYTDKDVFPFARIIKAGLRFSMDCLEKERDAIMRVQQEDLILYNDSGIYASQALEDIDLKMNLLRISFDDDFSEPNQLVNGMDRLSVTSSKNQLEANCYFFYQTAFNSPTRFFLSPLDVKVLLHAFGSFSNFPPQLQLTVENVSYGHTVSQTVLKRMKFMSHLPLGTEFALLDIDWRNSIDPEVYQKFSKELQERRRKHVSKVKREDHEKKRYDSQQEEKTKQFYMQENKGWGSYDFLESTTSFAEDPQAESEPQLSGTSPEGHDYTTTVWGTKIPKSNDPVHEQSDDELFSEALNAAAATSQGKRGKKKKFVIMSSHRA